MHDLADCFVDGVVEDACLMEGNLAMTKANIRQFILDSLTHFPECIVAVFLAQAVGLVDEDFEMYAWVVLRKKPSRVNKRVDRAEVVILHVDDPDDGTQFSEICV